MTTKELEPFVGNALGAIEDNPMVRRVKAFLPKAAKANKAFGKANSQTTSSLMTLNMIDAGPYRTLRQILAQVEKKKMALKEAGYKYAKAKIRIKKHSLRIKELALSERPDLVIERDELYIKIAKIESDLEDSKIYINAAIKEIGAFMDRYYEVLDSHNIKSNWDEKDFENAEIRHHITAIFRLAIRDRMRGLANMGTMEYMEQFGIEPVLAYQYADGFISTTKNRVNQQAEVDISGRYEFYDRMYERFKLEYYHALERLGLSTAVYEDWLSIRRQDAKEDGRELKKESKEEGLEG